jgi:hypothetical protein
MFEAWGTIFVLLGVLFGIGWVIMLVISLDQRQSVSKLLGFDDVDSARVTARIKIVAISLCVFFVTLAYFVKGGPKGHVQEVPEVEDMGLTQQTLRASEIDTPEELEPKQVEAEKAVLPEVNKSTEERDREINDYVQRALRRADGAE